MIDFSAIDFSKYRKEMLKAMIGITNEDDIRVLHKIFSIGFKDYNKLSEDKKELLILEFAFKLINENSNKTVSKIFFETGEETYNRYEFHGLDIIEKILDIKLNEDNIIKNITILRNEFYNFEPYNENNTLDKRKFRGLSQNDLIKINSHYHGLDFLIASINYEIFNQIFNKCKQRDRQRDLKKILKSLDKFENEHPQEVANIKEVIEDINSKIGLFLIFDSINKPHQFKTKKLSDSKKTIKLFDLTNNIYNKD
ncbi:hypothetical protein ACN2EN_08225 [Aliarcobacter lanthieri]|uniref:hypothetical protein n=1 Tax=Aliarcobacter lanthieri TaxID=1355374 RepID=UPI003AFADFBF